MFDRVRVREYQFYNKTKSRKMISQINWTTAVSFAECFCDCRGNIEDY